MGYTKTWKCEGEKLCVETTCSLLLHFWTTAESGSMASILSSSPYTPCLLVLLLETTCGTFSNAIVMVIILKGIKGKKVIKTGNIIRISLSTSNICYSVLVCASVFSGVLHSGHVQIINPTLTYIVYSLNMFTLSSSSWLTAILSFFYFIKIVDFKARAIVWTKKNVDVVVPWMMVGAEVVALFSSFLSMLLYINPLRSPVNDSVIRFNNSKTDMEFFNITLIPTFVPFFTIVVTTICIAGTLKKHSHNMKTNMGTLNNKAIKRFRSTVSKIKRLLLAYLLYYLCALLFYFAIAAHVSVQFWVSLLLLSSYTMVQAILLVVGNPKLQEEAKQMLKCIVCSQQMHS
ncbi:PREDICTED: taste receptor type 2 member 119-like [Nanorana parkeri]|uniref:taste receptor type 2 member 119-like n=1 Tax=Nanorana parkeri TaxID=125878 RepID=UPI00085488E2|nr:PREDICTED: taste receptor type 2 member 119-like [Nanorana parkeri]